ncbi:glycosyltransferase family 2 protein [cf. Phormidesmis sp. LEGE 11477]|uniref:glycosyltransferase family 2 protein n=1 Tax=cf. Phormidesmis sp. LEGE 11477 TaxID=1828680 RepID=UPI0018828F77|nr:glycosyltransferase family 2 protein [cf. Phormidesmis sp. LEGE 11477]MBE9062916.1 glycosyltransferase family 2 protein [cf. Phormidesmis sp. LEGE 11477]
MDTPLISAIICTHNREQYLGAAIDSLLQQRFEQYGNRYEVIVVDNASSDRTAEIAKSRLTHPNVQYVYEPTLGLSVARNRGAAAAKGKVLAYLDDDAEASDGWLAALWEVFEQAEKVAIAGGKVTLLWPPDTAPPEWLSDDLASSLGAYDLGDQPIYIEDPALTPRGLNYAVRQSFLTAIGGFDTHLGRVGSNLLSNEEQQLTRLALDDGWQVAYVPTALAAHNVAPERLKRGWFLRRSWWQGISESYREQASGTTGLWQLRAGGERLLRGLYKAVKHSRQPDQQFGNFAYAYGQIAYLGSVVRSWIDRQPTP